MNKDQLFEEEYEKLHEQASKGIFIPEDWLQFIIKVEQLEHHSYATTLHDCMDLLAEANNVHIPAGNISEVSNLNWTRAQYRFMLYKLSNTTKFAKGAKLHYTYGNWFTQDIHKHDS